VLAPVRIDQSVTCAFRTAINPEHASGHAFTRMGSPPARYRAKASNSFSSISKFE
jgi:hypothetical protein